MKSLQALPLQDIRQRPDVMRLKRRVGMAYGITVGVAFAASAWGIDGFQLSQAYALHPWLKFIVGAILCGLVGGAAGWLVARLEKGILAPFIYLGVSFFFSWLIVALPLQIFPRLVLWLDPDTGSMLNYIFDENFNSRFAVAFIWIAIFVSLAGILQIPLTEPTPFATSFFGRIAPLIVCTVIMFINGTIVDTLNNEPLRAAVLAVDKTIQFSLDHRGEEIDRAVSRTLHLSSLRAVQEVIDQPRRLIVGTYDRWLGQINVLIRFGDTWVDCATIYNQPSFCKYVTPEPP